MDHQIDGWALVAYYIEDCRISSDYTIQLKKYWATRHENQDLNISNNQCLSVLCKPFKYVKNICKTDLIKRFIGFIDAENKKFFGMEKCERK